MTAALALANQGFKIHLVERTDRLGGHLHDIHHTLEDMDVAALTAGLIKEVQENKNIDLYLGTEVAEIKGHIGEFHATLSRDGQKSEVAGGAIIVATGADRAETTKFLGGASANVITQVELEKRLHEGRLPAGLKTVVMIQCAGSRDTEHPYCSRICCSMAVKNALALKAKSPETDVFVLYRDIRTYGFREIYYKKAREAGVVFLRYVPEKEPVVSEPVGAGSQTRSIAFGVPLKVSVTSPDFPEPIEIEADQVVLSTGIATDRTNNKRVSDMLKVPLNADGFYVEAHMKLRPVDFASEGIFLCGLAHSPKFIDESIAQARGGGAGGDRAVQDTARRQPPGLLRRSEQVHLVHDVRARLPVQCPVLQHRWQGPDRGRQVHGLRHLCLPVSGPRDSTESLRDQPVPRDAAHATGRGQRKVGSGQSTVDSSQSLMIANSELSTDN